MKSNPTIAIIGLGYVGLPLARLFSTQYSVIGFDINEKRIQELSQGHDCTDGVSDTLLQAALANRLVCTASLEDIRPADIYIVTVPTPVDENNHPVLTPLRRASETVGQVISSGNIVIYESTVYPGVTEEECLPIVAQVSGLTYNKDFFAGYSPERINPGDKSRPVELIKKVTSGSTPEITDYIDRLYGSVLQNGTHKAASIRVAEASKIIENAQRDINIAFMNEIAKIFNLLDIDTTEVIEAAASKWNFIPLKPGLVGGHCIGIDPYYLIEKSLVHRFNPRIMSEARTLNDSMGSYVAGQVIKLMNLKDCPAKDARILILGFTFKENCPDIRNTKVIDIYRSLKPYTDRISILDPHADGSEVIHEYDVEISAELPNGQRYDAIILAVAHDEFGAIDPRSLLTNPETGVIYDVKSFYPKSWIDARL